MLFHTRKAYFMQSRSDQVRRRGMTAPAIVALALFLLTACSVEDPDQASEDEGEASETATDEEASEAADSGDADAELSVGYTEDTYGPDRLGKWPLNARLYDTLVNMNEDLELQPMLATEWDHDVESNTYTFQLREGVAFHDGTEFTAEDVAFTLGRTAEDPTNYQKLSPDGITVVDDHTIEVTPGERNNRLIEQLAHPSFGMNRADSDPMDPVGTGPFQFVQYDPDEQLVVERFDDYWDSDRVPQVAGITFNFVDDFQTRVLGLRSGDLDIIADVSADATDEVEGVEGAELATSGPAAFGRVDMNIAGEEPYDILEDEQVRHAVAMAVDREELIDTVYSGFADTEPLPSHLFGEHADSVEGVAHDPEGAEELLAEAGWEESGDGIREKGGEQLALSYLPLSPTPDANRIGEVLQQQLSDVGIQVELDPAGDPAITSERREAGEYDLLHQGGSQNDANPCFLLDLLYYSPEQGGRDSNAYLAPGGAVDDAIDACREAESIDGAKEAAAETARLLIEDEYIYIPVGNAYRIWAHADAVEGFVAHPGLGRANFEEISVSR